VTALMLFIGDMLRGSDSLHANRDWLFCSMTFPLLYDHRCLFFPENTQGILNNVSASCCGTIREQFSHFVSEQIKLVNMNHTA